MAKMIRKYQRFTTIYVLIFSLITFFSGAHLWGWLPVTHAAAMSSVKDLISTSVPSTVANHTITFTMPAGQTWAVGETLTLTFDNAAQSFNLGALANTDPLDYDIRTDTAGANTDESIVAAGGCAANDAIEITTINTTTDVITFTACGSYTAPANASIIEIQIGLHAALGGAGNSQITNAAAGTYQIDLAGTIGSNDTGTAMVAIIAAVTVSVTVDESLSVAIATVAAASCPGTLPGTDKSDDAGHSATAITFGTLTSGDAFNHSCEQLTISTNASGGYSTTVEKNQLLTAVSTIADGACENPPACSTTASEVWTTTTKNGFGYCMDDVTGDAALTADGTHWAVVDQCDNATPEFKLFGTLNANAQAIMSSAAAVSGDNSIIAAVLNYPTTQAAGTYTTTLTFITTPTF